jgi:UDP-N-acetylmuramoylalanine--D-glutamate ligase
MRAAELRDKKVAIWGIGREGKAAAKFIHKMLPHQALLFVDEAPGPDKVDGLPDGSIIVRGGDLIGSALDGIDVVIKSPGVSLYNPIIQRARKNGAKITSLLNLWIAEPHGAKIICVTGTKGKSTASNLLAHTLRGLGRTAGLGGNIGVPIAEIDGNIVDYVVIEVSSYQAADFDGLCDIAVLTSLHPEHLDWHGSAETYFGDKLHLLERAKTSVVAFDTLETVVAHKKLTPSKLHVFNRPDGMHTKDGVIFDKDHRIGAPENAHLARPHNLSNVCAVLSVIKLLSIDVPAALEAMKNYQPLPHRQQELGEKDGLLFVNDSIATAPHAAIAALEFYHNRPVTIIAGGYDRGIDYAPLVDYILAHDINAVICMGPSGKRIHEGLRKHRELRISLAATMTEAVERAKKETPAGGVVLLSPAAPSYGLFKDFTERGRAFAAKAGFEIKA